VAVTLLLGGTVLGVFLARAYYQPELDRLAAAKAEAEDRAATATSAAEKAAADLKAVEEKASGAGAALAKALADKAAADEALRTSRAHAKQLALDRADLRNQFEKLKSAVAKLEKEKAVAEEKLARRDPPAVKPDPAPDAASLRGEPLKVDDLTMTPLKLDTKTLLPFFCWADDKGSAFLTLDQNGVLRRISFPELKVEKQQDLDRKCSGLAVSAEGPLVAVPDPQQVWLIDSDTLAVKKKIDVPGVRNVAGTRASSVAVASGSKIYSLDLKKGEAAPYEIPKQAGAGAGVNGPVMTPDGKYVFTTGLGGMLRFSLTGGKLRYEESSPGLVNGPVFVGVQVSPDSRLVCLPSRNGNYGASKDYGVFLYPVDTFKKPEMALETGMFPGAVIIDPRAGAIYATGGGGPLTVFSLHGVPKKSYKVPAADVRQHLLHPDGGKFLLFLGDKVWSVEVPRKKAADGRGAGSSPRFLPAAAFGPPPVSHLQRGPDRGREVALAFRAVPQAVDPATGVA
jgi:hypothetical protein